MGTVAITVSKPEATSLYQAFIMGTSAQVWGEDVILFFQPEAAAALKPGVLEGITQTGFQDMKDLLSTYQELDGRILLCELFEGAYDMKKEDIREGVEIVNAPRFMMEAIEAGATFSF